MSSNRILAILGGVVAVLIVAIVIVSVVVLARGGGGSSRGGSSGRSSARGAQTLRVPGEDPLTLDPAQVFDTTSANYVVELFGGLVTLDRDLKIIPDVAKSMPEVSSDGKTYT